MLSGININKPNSESAQKVFWNAKINSHMQHIGADYTDTNSALTQNPLWYFHSLTV